MGKSNIGGADQSWNDSGMWAQIPGYANYFASKSGAILSFQSGKAILLNPLASKRTGHQYVFLYNGTRESCRKIYVHQAVLRAFVGESGQGQESRHLDGNPANNTLKNLVWGTHAENVIDRARHGRMPIPHLSPFTKLKPEDIPNIRSLSQDGTSSRAIAAIFDTSHTTILKILRGQRWKGY